MPALAMRWHRTHSTAANQAHFVVFLTMLYSCIASVGCRPLQRLPQPPQQCSAPRRAQTSVRMQKQPNGSTETAAATQQPEAALAGAPSTAPPLPPLLSSFLPLSILTDSYKASHFLQYPPSTQMVAVSGQSRLPRWPQPSWARGPALVLARSTTGAASMPSSLLRLYPFLLLLFYAVRRVPPRI